MQQALFLQLLTLFAGYIFSVFVAVIALSFFIIYFLASLELIDIFYFFAGSWQSIKFWFLSALALTACFGFPGWLATVVLAEKFSIREKYWFARAGALNTLAAFLLASLFTSDMSIFSAEFFLRLSVSLPMVICGYLAGLAYWRVVGWRSGTWRSDQSASLPAKDFKTRPAGRTERVLIQAARIYSGLIAGNLVAGSGIWLKSQMTLNGSSGLSTAGGLHALPATLDTAGFYLFFPAVAVFLVAQWQGNRSPQFHAACGAIVALVAFFLLSTIGGLATRDANIPALAFDIAAVSLCGAANGIVYWLIAVPGASRFLSRFVPFIAPSTGS